MEKSKIELAKVVFKQTNTKVEKNINDTKFHEFRNSLRMTLTTDWQQTGNQLVHINYETGYISQLEQILFDLLKEPRI